MNGKKIKNILFVVLLVILIIFSRATAPKCDNCGNGITGDKYKAYSHTYCSTCAHRLYPGATWK